MVEEDLIGHMVKINIKEPQFLKEKLDWMDAENRLVPDLRYQVKSNKELLNNGFLLRIIINIKEDMMISLVIGSLNNNIHNNKT